METDPQKPVNGSARKESILNSRTWLDHLFVVREHWILAILVALSLAGFYIYKSLQTTPLYKSQAILIFEVQQDRVINIEQVVDTSLGRAADYVLRNHLTDLRSNSFRVRVVESLTPEEKELIIKDYRDPESEDDPNIHGIIAEANNIQQMGGNIFRFEFHHRNPQAAALLANRFSEEFNDFLLERSRKRTESALRFLRSQSEELKLKVERSELAVQRYRQERNLVSLEESQNLVVERMKSLSGNLNAARIELLNLESTIEQIKNNIGDLDALAELPAINQMGSVPAKFERRTALKAERATLALRYGKRHPQMIANASALEALEIDLQETLEKNVSDSLKEYENLTARVQNLEEALAEAEQEALNLDQIAIEYNVLRRKLETDKRLFTQVHQRLNEAILASQLTDSNLRVVDQAWPATQPFTPDTRKIYSTGVALFILCFLGVPYAIHYLNLNLKTASDIEMQLEIPFLGELRKFSKKIPKLHRVVMDQSDPEAAELFRQIHSQILLKQGRLEKGHTFIVTSAIPKEGKSFFAINLAASFGRHHYKTLLIDCDFRRPSIALRMKEEFAGYDESGSLTPRPLQINENFSVLGAFADTVEATELVESVEFREHFRRMQNEFDILIVDTAPSGLFPDAGLIGNYGHHFLFVTQLNKHRKRLLKAVIDRLNQSQAQVLGIIVNKVSKSRSKNLGVYKYMDYGKYKNYYPSKPAAKKQPVESKQ